MIDEKKLIKDYMNNYLVKNDGTWNDAIDRVVQLAKTAPKVGEWIPVSERLPDSIEDVLVTVNGRFGNIIFDNAILIGSYSTDGWWIEEYGEWENPIVTAWLPLPEPYKEKEL